MMKSLFTGAAESDMDLDLLAESESDSESSHSNQDNVSVQRSAVTAATAGSDAGKDNFSFLNCSTFSFKVIQAHYFFV
jgi:E3 ubiquitin-protein ligase EDD1